MASNRKPRRKYRPGAVHVNAVQLAIRRAGKLDRADVLGQHRLQQSALTEFAAWKHCAAHWRTLADAANMAETLAGIGIGTGADALTLRWSRLIRSRRMARFAPSSPWML